MRVRVIKPTKITNTKKKVCAYARVSSDSMSQGESLDNQITYYKALISSNPEYEFIDVFADRGVTGTKEDRPEFKRMMELARNKEIDLIITKSISRFARNTTIVLEIVRELKDIGVEVRFEKENINSLSGDGELMLSVLSSLAEEESRSTSENMKWIWRKKFEKGELVINTKRFLGYDKDKKGNLVINDKQAQIVKRIYSEYLEGNGTFKIAKMLNQENVKTVTGAKWHESTILNILKNEKYKGDAKLQKTYVKDYLSKKKCINKGEYNSYYIKDNHQSIVSRETWDEVQELIEAKSTSVSTNRYPLSGMLYCSKCGAYLKRRTWNTSKKIVWQCSNYINNGKSACKGTVIDDDRVANIKEKTIVKEIIKNGKKYYSYTRKD